MDRGVSSPVNMKLAAAISTSFVLEEATEKILDLEHNPDIRDGEEIPLIESKVIPIQKTCGIDASTFLIRLGILYRKDNNQVRIYEIIFNIENLYRAEERSSYMVERMLWAS